MLKHVETSENPFTEIGMYWICWLLLFFSLRAEPDSGCFFTGNPLKFVQVFHLRPLTTSDALGTLVTLSVGCHGMPHVTHVWVAGCAWLRFVVAEFLQRFAFETLVEVWFASRFFRDRRVQRLLICTLCESTCSSRFCQVLDFVGRSMSAFSWTLWRDRFRLLILRDVWFCGRTDLVQRYSNEEM